MAQLEQISKPTLADWRQRWRQLKKVGSEYKGPCPNRHCPGGPGKDRFWVKQDGSFGCRHCEPGKDNPDAYKAILKGAGLFKVNPKTNGHAKVNGHAAPTQYAVIKAPKPPPGFKINQGYHWVSTHGYDTVDGQRFYVVRQEPDDGEGKKIIRRDRSGIDSKALPLGHHKLDLSKPVVITEGEKDRDAVIAHTNGEYQCTTWPGGAVSWHKTDWTCLAGCEVILWPDRDDVGNKAMEDLADHLFELGCKVKAVDHPMGEQDGWGAADCEPGQATELIRNAYVPEGLGEKKEPDDDEAPDKTSDFCDLVIPPETDIKMPEHLITNVIEVGSVSLLVGKPGHGKSNLALIEALALASGRSDILHDNAAVTQCRVGLVWCDESRPVLLAKLRAIMKTYNIKDADITGNLTLLEDQDGNTFPGMLTSNKVMDHIHKRAVHHEVRVIVVDSVATTAPDAEADNKIASRVSQQLTRLATVINGGVMLLHHARKGPVNEGIEEGLEAGRGASGLTGPVRIARQIIKETEANTGKTVFRVSSTKASYFNEPDDVYWKVDAVPLGTTRPAPVFVTTRPTDPFNGVTSQQAEDAYRAMLKKPVEKRKVSTSSSDWAGVVIADIFGWNVGADRKNNNQRSKEQIAYRNRVAAILNAWMKSEVLTTTKTDIKMSNRGTRSIPHYAYGPKQFGKA